MFMIVYKLKNRDEINFYSADINDLKKDLLIEQDWNDLNEVNVLSINVNQR